MNFNDTIEVALFFIIMITLSIMSYKQLRNRGRIKNNAKKSDSNDTDLRIWDTTTTLYRTGVDDKEVEGGSDESKDSKYTVRDM